MSDEDVGGWSPLSLRERTRRSVLGPTVESEKRECGVPVRKSVRTTTKEVLCGSVDGVEGGGSRSPVRVTNGPK